MPNPVYSRDHDACGVGFVTHLGGGPSHEIVERALTALLRLAHRGGLDADGRSGDGAGLLMTVAYSSNSPRLSTSWRRCVRASIGSLSPTPIVPSEHI